MRLIESEQITKMMSDLVISKDAVNMTGERQGLWVRFRAIEKAVSEIPTIDAVEVVRCKDCVAYDEDGVCNCDSLYMHIMGDSFDSFEPNENFYCGFGERREP